MESLSGTLFCARFCDNSHECPYERQLGCNQERKVFPPSCMPCPCARPADPAKLAAFLVWLDDWLVEEQQDRAGLGSKLERRRLHDDAYMVQAI